MINRRTVLLGAVGAAAVLAAPHLASAQAFPNKPIRWILGVPAGGGLDIQARLLADSMQQTLGQPVVVENKSGANGAIAASTVAASPPDGHTLITFNVSDFAMYPHLVAKPTYDPGRDFAMVGMTTEVPFILMVNAKLPVNNLAEFVAYVRAQPPNAVNYASGGPGSFQHVMMAMLADQYKLQMTHVPYRGGSQALTDLVSGQNQVQFTVAATAQVHVQSGALKALGVTMPKRLKAFPNLPTLVEQGAKIDIPAWSVLATVAGTPKPAIARLNQALTIALDSPPFVERMAKIGVLISSSSADDADKYVQQQLAEWGDTLKRLNLKLD